MEPYAESVRMVRGHMGESGWSPRSGFPELRSREIRVSPLQLLRARKGNQVVPRKNVFFALSRKTWGVLFFGGR